MRHVLSRLNYTDRREGVVGRPDPLIVGSAADVLEDDSDGVGSP
jgi:hypothetical protein